MKFVAFRTLIENEVGNPSTNDASSSRVRTLILQWTNQAYRELCQAFSWPWLESTTTISLTATNSSVAIPSTVKAILDLQDTAYTPYKPIRLMPMEQFRTGQYQITDSGEPEYATFWAGSLQFDCKAAATRTYSYRAVLFPTELNASDNSGLGTEILVPESDLFTLQDGVLAYWYRWRKDGAFTTQLQLFRQRIQEMVARCRRGPDHFYPDEQLVSVDPNQRGYRVTIT